MIKLKIIGDLIYIFGLFLSLPICLPMLLISVRQGNIGARHYDSSCSIYSFFNFLLII